MEEWSGKDIRRVFLKRANEYGRLRDRLSVRAARNGPVPCEEYDRVLARWAVYDSLWNQSVQQESSLASRENLLATLQSMRSRPRFSFAAYSEATFNRWWVAMVETLVRAFQTTNGLHEVP